MGGQALGESGSGHGLGESRAGGFRARVKKNFTSFIHRKSSKNGVKKEVECDSSTETVSAVGSDSSTWNLSSSLQSAETSPFDSNGASRTPTPEEFICPISKTLMAEPVIVESGISYERQSVLAYFQLGYKDCFKTCELLEHLTPTKNSALKKAIDHWCDSHQVPRPVAPDAETAQETVRQCLGLNLSCNPFEFHVESSSLDTTSSFLSSSDSHQSSESTSQRKNVCPGGAAEISNDFHAAECTSESKNACQEAAGAEEDVFQEASAKVVPFTSEEMSQWKHKVRKGVSQDGIWTAVGDRAIHSCTALSKAEGLSQEGTCPAGPSANGGGERSEDMEASGRGGSGCPLPLTRTPAAFSEQIIGIGVPNGSLDREAIDLLLKRLKQPQPLEQEATVFEIRMHTRVSAENRIKLCEPDFVKALIPLAQSRYSMVQINAVAALMNLTLEKENKLKMARCGVIPTLIDVMKSGALEAQEHAAGAIFSLALNDQNKMAIGVLGAIPPLVHILRVTNHGGRRDAAMALYHLSFSQINRNKLIKGGGLKVVVGIARDERSDMVSRALMILCNMSANQEGRVALQEMKAVQALVGLLSRGDGTVHEEGEEDPKVNWAEIREHAAATLLLLSHHNYRFKSQALQAGALEKLQRLVGDGTPRAREKAKSLLAILRDNSENSEEGSFYRRSYVRSGVDDEKAGSAKF